MSTVVTIGRNVGDVPLSAESWERFRSRTLAAVREACESVYFVGTGAGIWEDEREEAFTIVADDTTSERAYVRLSLTLSELCKLYRQDAIALTRGGTMLVH